MTTAGSFRLRRVCAWRVEGIRIILFLFTCQLPFAILGRCQARILLAYPSRIHNIIDQGRRTYRLALIRQAQTLLIRSIVFFYGYTEIVVSFLGDWMAQASWKPPKIWRLHWLVVNDIVYCGSKNTFTLGKVFIVIQIVSRIKVVLISVYNNFMRYSELVYRIRSHRQVFPLHCWAASWGV